jgi:hypothetical protein
MKTMTLISKPSEALGSGWIFGALSGAAIVALLLVVMVPIPKEGKICDQAVSTLLTTTDAVKLQRTMFLIRRLDCKISTRL